jgi:hypothetical protein
MPKFNRVVNASWHHDEVFKIGPGFPESEFSKRFDAEQPGMVVAFEQPVRIDSLHHRSVLMLGTRRERQGLLYDCRIPLKLDPRDFNDNQTHSHSRTWLIRENEFRSNFSLINETDPATEDDYANAVAIAPEIGWRDLIDALIPEEPPFHIELTVILRGDWILDRDGRSLDGNHIWPGVPQTTGEITYFVPRVRWPSIQVRGRPSGNGTEGGDWISEIHIDIDRD